MPRAADVGWSVLRIGVEKFKGFAWEVPFCIETSSAPSYFLGISISPVRPYHRPPGSGAVYTNIGTVVPAQLDHSTATIDYSSKTDKGFQR